MATTGNLRGRREHVERARGAWADGGTDPAGVRPEIAESWQRSANVSPDLDAAPLANPDETAEQFSGSALDVAVGRLQPELRRAAEDGDLVVAVSDPQTRILWTYGGRVMRRRAESVNFVVGGRWDEESVGTNALNLALRTDRTQTVFSAEHYASIVHNWVCWAAPVHDPVTGTQLGVLDLSTTWDRAHPIGAATAQALARLLEREVPDLGAASAPVTLGQPRDPGLRLRLLGAAEATLDGARLLLTRRQTEILALLSLHPEGLTLDQLHAHLYGDKAVSASTLKAEVSHLRAALGGQLASRPYRLTVPVTTDVTTVEGCLRSGDVDGALESYGGDLVPGTESPALMEHADYLAVAVREAVLADPTPRAALRHSEIAPYDTEVVERALARLGEAHHPLRALLRARLTAR
ncbi:MULTISPECIES: transcriptional regulator [unclassified Janibacter]|uniref:transcriptional regulator n=1 Tax=unclassified Janibacter TaxID=2649294 RepID=UPI003D05F9AC